MKVSRAKTPFRREDTDEREKLRASPHAIASFICNEKSPVKQGEMLGKGLYSHTPFKHHSQSPLFILTFHEINRTITNLIIVYELVLLKRGYETKGGPDGKAIGDDIPPQKTAVIHVKSHPDEKEKLAKIMATNMVPSQGKQINVVLQGWKKEKRSRGPGFAPRRMAQTIARDHMCLLCGLLSVIPR
jgi:hypothetical protein